MKPLAETLDFLQGDQNTYYGYLLPSIISMYTKLEKIKLSGEIRQLSKPLEYILDSIRQKRFKDLFTLKSKMAVIVAVTSLRFKMRWFSGLRDENIITTCKDIQSWVLEAALELDQVQQSEVAVDENIEGDPFFDFKEDFNSLISLISSSNQSQYEYELLRYLNDSRSNIQMLTDYPMMKKLFIKYNSVLPSSAPVERLFSFAQIINAPRRHALSDINFEKLVLLKSNSTLRI